MQPPAQTRVFASLLDDVRESRPPQARQGTADPAFYTDERWFQAEQRKLFADTPLVVGHVSMLPNSGDHLVHDHSGKPILLVRGKDQKIRAFLNVCRHRGVRLSNADKVENRTTFVCPYHNWIYDLDGSLHKIPLKDECFDELDKDCLGLTELPLTILEGLILVSGTPTGSAALPNGMAELKEDFRAFGLAEHTFFRQSVTTKDANWKLIIEAFLDGYHVVRLHRKTVGPLFLDCVAKSERKGDNIISVVARQEFSDALSLPEQDWDLRHHASCAFFLYPNTTLIVHPDYISYLTLFPQSASKTVCVHGCLIPEPPQDEKAAAHWERAYSIIENGVFQAEDLFVCEQAQIGMSSGANEKLLFGTYESSIIDFHQILAEQLGPYQAQSG
ncbi:SRPBCC family protein [Litorivivens sp.]|uniref:aromatic ring-hydroxylating oxygenase subunit alpha n=1 Tax=Litorivivens sp. TaxID=2020868 RepID=UPI00356311EA